MCLLTATLGLTVLACAARLLTLGLACGPGGGFAGGLARGLPGRLAGSRAGAASGPALTLSGARRLGVEEYHRLLERHRLDGGVLGQSRAQGPVLYVGAIASHPHCHRPAVCWVGTKDGRARFVASPGEEVDGAVEPDGENVILLERDVLGSFPDVRTVTADAG